MGQLLAVAAELLLLFACLYAAVRSARILPLGLMLVVPGALLLGLAALLGALEYAGLDNVIEAHQLSSRIAGGLALPALMVAPGLTPLPGHRQQGFAALALVLMLCGLVFSVPQIGQVLLIAGLLAAAVPAFTRRGRLLAGWIAMLACFGLTLFSRSQVDGPLSLGMTGFHAGLALLVVLLTCQFSWTAVCTAQKNID